MAHTNSTTNYSLPLFINTDKPAWLTDINGAFSNIDTAIKAAKDAGDNAQSDATQAASDASDALTAANAADGKGSGAVASLANAFSSSSIYAVGDMVTYNNLLYVCSTAVNTPGAWTGATNWTRVNVDKFVKDADANLQSQINNKADASAIPVIATDISHSTVPTGANIAIDRQRVGKAGALKFCEFIARATNYNSGSGAILKVPSGYEALVLCDLIGIKKTDGTGIPLYINDDTIYLNGPSLTTGDSVIINGFYI